MSYLRVGDLTITTYERGGPVKMMVHIPKKEKICSKIVDCVFINYAQNSNAYRFFV